MPYEIAHGRYGGPHRAPELQKEAVYGITELHREDVRSARLVANPGCYPTSVQLPLVPLLQASTGFSMTRSKVGLLLAVRLTGLLRLMDSLGVQSHATLVCGLQTRCSPCLTCAQRTSFHRASYT